MYVICYHCNGTGYNHNMDKEIMLHEGTDIPSYVCITCYTPFWWEDIELRGKIWIQDNSIPITPPSSP
jgi:hypothetical protein